MNIESLPILLPIGWFVACLVWQAKQMGSLRRAFFLSAVLWGALLTVLTELLSLVRWLTPGAVATAWLIVCLPLLVVVVRERAIPAFANRASQAWRSLPRVDQILLLVLGMFCAVLFGIAVLSPPNNVDSFLYHMARVMHWQQGRGLQPYPTLIDHQLNKPIWAETAILHLRMLWGNDRPAALVQWFSLVGSLVAASAVSQLLGGSRRAQILAMWLCASIPMGILQATSTQNDYVAAFWSIILAYLVVLASTRPLDRLETACLGLVTGLGMLTKGTFFVYAPPLLAWYALGLLRSRRTGTLARSVMVIGVAVIVVNSGFWTRNIVVYGGPYGTSEWLLMNLGLPGSVESALGGVQATPVPPGQAASPTAEPDALQVTAADCAGCTESQGGPLAGVRDYARLLAWTAGRNLTFPVGWLQTPVTRFLADWEGVFGADYAAEIAASAWNHEDHAGNPLHLAFVPLGLALALLRRAMPARRKVLSYMLVVLATYLLLPVVIGHGASYWGIRYQLPFFVLWAPGLAAALVSPRTEAWVAGGAFLLAVFCLPWLLLNNMRPLIGMPPWPTRTQSILVEDPVNVLFATNPALADDYQLSVSAIQDAGCTQVGLNAGSEFLEYPLWWLLNAPQSGVRIEVLNSDKRLEPYADASFTPCAVVCTQCEGQAAYGSLPFLAQNDSIRLFMAR